MEFGICIEPEKAAEAKAAGFKFIDAKFDEMLKPAASQAEFEDAYAARFASIALPVRNTVCLLPGGYSVAGPRADIPKAVAYCAAGLGRAGRLGVRTVCFGSGAARTSPAGWPLEKAVEQIRDFVAALAPVARSAGVKLVIENLSRSETNTLNMLQDIRSMVDSVGDPGVGILLDGYHWMINGDTVDKVVENRDLVFHTHIATWAQRRAPGEEQCDFSPFAKALSMAGYGGDMAVEGSLADRSEQALAKVYKALCEAFA